MHKRHYLDVISELNGGKFACLECLLSLQRGSDYQIWKKVQQSITLLSHLRTGRPKGLLVEVIVNWSNLEVALSNR